MATDTIDITAMTITAMTAMTAITAMTATGCALGVRVSGCQEGGDVSGYKAVRVTSCQAIRECGEYRGYGGYRGILTSLVIGVWRLFAPAGDL